MKKYKLLKELPLAEAGTEVFINENINMICKYGDSECVIPIAHIIISEKDEWLEEVVEKPKSVWDLKEGDDFYYIFKNNVRKDFITICEAFRIYHLDEGNAFLTKEEAEKELEKRKAIQKIKRYCWENDINNNYFGIFGYFFKYNQSHKNIEISSSFNKNGNPLGYFSLENAQKILDNFEEELKIILN